MNKKDSSYSTTLDLIRASLQFALSVGVSYLLIGYLLFISADVLLGENASLFTMDLTFLAVISKIILFGSWFIILIPLAATTIGFFLSVKKNKIIFLLLVPTIVIILLILYPYLYGFSSTGLAKASAGSLFFTILLVFLLIPYTIINIIGYHLYKKRGMKYTFLMPFLLLILTVISFLIKM